MDPIHIRRLILHPGSPKTGTSGIQNALFRAREALLEQGFLYPRAGVSKTGGTACGHHGIALGLDPERPEPDDALRQMLEALRGEIAECPGHAVILSSEEFFGAARLSVLKTLLRAEDCHVYVSLRPQHEVLNANYYTQVTHRRICHAPETYFAWAVDHLHYLDTLEALSEFAPRTRMSLRLFEKGSAARSGPLEDFASTLGLHLPESAIETAVEHPTLPAQPTLFLRWLNELGFDQKSFFDIFTSLHRMRARLPSQMFTIAPDRIAEVTRRFEAENREIRRRFRDGEDLPLFHPPEIPDTACWNAEVGKDHARVERDFLRHLCRLAARDE